MAPSLTNWMPVALEMARIASRNQARSALRRQAGIHHIMQRTAGRVAHGSAVAVHGQEPVRVAGLRRRLPASPGEWPLLRSPAEVRRRRGLSPRTRPPRPARLPRLPGRVLPALILPGRVLPGLIRPGLILPRLGLLPGTKAEVQHTREAGVPVRHSPPRGTPHATGAASTMRRRINLPAAVAGPEWRGWCRCRG